MNPFNSATDWLGLLKEGKCSALEILEYYLERVDRYNPDLNAIVWEDREAARKAAAAVSGKPDAEQPLRGLPITIKEAYDLAGAPTTWGVPAMRDNIAAKDSVVAARLKAAGAIIFGKTNVPIGLMDLQSYNDVYGTTVSPWNAEHSPGGSSGGSAAAMAAGLSVFEMGSDIAGSIRTPAHFCGIFGHKPTYAIIPTRGHGTPGVLMDPDIGVVGPLTRSAGDLELLLDVLVGADDYQPGVRYELPRLGQRTLGDLRVAVWSNDDVMPVETEIEDRVIQVADALRDAGAQVDDGARPAIDVARSHEIYRELLWSFLSVSESDEAFEAMKQRVNSGTASDEDYAARLESLVTIDHRHWLHLHNAREELRWAWHRFFQDYDVLLAPQSPTTALRHDHSDITQRQLRVGGTNYPYYEQFFWAGLTGVAWLPSTAIPTGLSKDGLPIGIQIVGNAYHDYITIGVARQLEELGYRFTPPPGFN